MGVPPAVLTSLLGGFLNAAAPLMFASLGALLTELAGSLGIFIEGFMNLGAFFTYFFWVKTGTLAAAAALVMAFAAAAGFLLARFVHLSKADPFIAALALNLASDGLTATLSAQWFGTKGVLRIGAAAAPVQGSLLSPVVGYGVCFILAALLITRTAFGLRLRAAGLSPAAAEARGISASRYREAAWTAAALLAAAGGVCLTARFGAYTPGGAAGRGWIALAAVYLGFRKVWGTALAALVFTLVERIGISLQRLSVLPATALLGIPSALALLFYALSCLAKKMEKRTNNVARKRRL
jgi:simple sugar transport system permease protein